MSAVPATTSSRSTWVPERIKKKGEQAFDTTYKLANFASSCSSGASYFGFSEAREISKNMSVFLEGCQGVDVLREAYWLRTGERKSWQHSTASAIGATQSILTMSEATLKRFGVIFRKIGHIPVINLVISSLKLLSAPFRIWHNVKILRRSDQESEQILDKLEIIRFKMKANLFAENESKNTLQVLYNREIRILKNNRTDAKLDIIGSINTTALSILTISALCTGGVAAVTASIPIMVLGLYMQIYSLAIFLYRSCRKNEEVLKANSDLSIVEQFQYGP